jgi:chromosome segregation ATPase
MKVDRACYERLFSLPGYNNEKIRLEAQLEEGETEGKVIGGLFFQVLKMEEVIEAFRSIQGKIEQVFHAKENKKGTIRHLESSIADMKLKIRELEKQISEGGEIDEKLRHACSTQSYKGLSESLKQAQADLEELSKKEQLLIEARDILKTRLQNGELSLEGLQIPQVREYY